MIGLYLVGVLFVGIGYAVFSFHRIVPNWNPTNDPFPEAYRRFGGPTLAICGLLMILLGFFIEP